MGNITFKGVPLKVCYLYKKRTHSSITTEFQIQWLTAAHSIYDKILLIHSNE